MAELLIDKELVYNLNDHEKKYLNNLYDAKNTFEKKFNIPFSINITKNYSSNTIKNDLVYVLSKDFNIKENNNIRKLYGESAIIDAFKLASKDFINRSKSVLLYLGKFPGYGFDIDGGSILALKLIDSLKIRCNLTVCFIRKNEELFFDSDVFEIKYVKYKDPWNNKFIRRLKNLQTNNEVFSSYKDYDIIISAHISKFFGMEKFASDFWKKTIVFPMFCTKSYVKSGEKVPFEYTEQEQIVIDNVEKIITPSNDEKRDLINDYGCLDNKIHVINRDITSHIIYRQRALISKNSIKLVCIGTIKIQKNTKETLMLIDLLIKNNIKCELHLVTTIQDKKYYSEFCEMVEKLGFCEIVKYHISISQKELAELLNDMDINISMSSWETFGRGIFEGASAGLPTFVFDKLETVKELTNNNYGFCFSRSVDEMASNIVATVKNKEIYNRMSKSLSEIFKKFSYKTEQNLLLEAIFG